ncbi:MAG: sensor histidine kinase [Lachnospiraceae bacterium]|nr:sensor histidine kinase [Lachnospiraceae bacterium]
MDVREEMLYCFFTGLLYLGYAWLAKQFCKKYLTCSPKRSTVFLILAYFSYETGNLICQNVSYLGGMVSTHLMFVGITILLFQGEREKKILTSVLWIAIMELAAEAGGSCFSILLLVCLHTTQGELVIQGSGELAISFLQVLTVAGFVYLLREPLGSVMEGKVKRWYLIAAFPPLCVIGIRDFFTWGITRGIMMRGEESLGLYQNQLISHSFNLVLALLGILGLGFYIFGLNQIYREQAKGEQYQAQVDSYRLLEEQYVKMERLRHDMKNHVLGLQGLLEHQEWKKMDQYLQKMLETGSLLEAREVTGNQAIDALLSQKRQRAEKKGISWDCAMYLPGDIKIEDFDFCVILGNLLDNSIEACEKIARGQERWIAIRSERKKGFLILEVKNSINAEACKKIVSGPKMVSGRKVIFEKTALEKVISGKKEVPGNHGIGLWNVWETVERYQGVMRVEQEDQSIAVSILLPCETICDKEETS